ncbi:phosphoribosyltransferase family protein [Iamia majanohamensis]|uniref:Phosphoribosyltransferase family protein n=1 Tax=Iamia majanohamensis TaxID=467976 RepID=A0AAF0BRJ4_9ACTN|nr:phosphoribosyltransferase family protein [Iamia majanohamensis]WCO66786.1 phosphoribosyltransferase family protein [Iamia majanohamensis]
MSYRDRADAGARLGEVVRQRAPEDPLVLGLPRGGVPVAAQVAAALGCPLDVVVARKVGAPGQPELGIGAVAEGGGEVLDAASVRALGVSDAALTTATAAAREELGRRVATYRGGRPRPPLDDHVVVLVDDGLATGVTAEAAVRGLRALGADRIVLAVPVGAPEAVARLGAVADEVVCPLAPERFRAVGQWYDRFGQTGDAEVLRLLGRTPPHDGG